MAFKKRRSLSSSSFTPLPCLRYTVPVWWCTPKPRQPHRRTVRVSPFNPPTRPPPSFLRMGTTPRWDCFPPSLFSTSESILFFFFLFLFFAFWCKWSAGRQAVSRPVTLAVSCRARALNPRHFFAVVWVWVSVLVVLRPPCVCYYFSCFCLCDGVSSFTTPPIEKKEKERGETNNKSSSTFDWNFISCVEQKRNLKKKKKNSTRTLTVANQFLCLKRSNSGSQLFELKTIFVFGLVFFYTHHTDMRFVRAQIKVML